MNEFLSHFHKVKKNASGWMACCPAHADGNASLSITQAADGKILLHCFAGCDVNAILAAAGLQMKDLFPKDTQQSQAQQKKIVAVYPYVDEFGNLLYEVIRYQPKDFRQRHPDGKGGHVWNMQGVRRVLYRLPQILDGIKTGETIYIVEGEKDADALCRAGLVACCNVGGADKWCSGYTDSLAGAHVAIIADKDAPGRKHAARVAGELLGKAESVRVLELPDIGAFKVKDPADWIEAGGTAEELVEMVANTQECADAQQLQEAEEPKEPAKTNHADMPDDVIILPSNAGAEQGATILECSKRIFKKMQPRREVFNRGGVVSILGRDKAGRLNIENLDAMAFCSEIERYGSVFSYREGENGQYLKSAICTSEVAARLIACKDGVEMLDPISGIVSAPVLANTEDGLKVLEKGYHRHSGGILVTDGTGVKNVQLKEAVEAIKLLVSDFDFVCPGDRSRAIAAFITPAMRSGNLLNYRTPVDIAEANQSQSGKGFRQELIFALYRETPAMLSQKRGGVGSLDESIQAAMLTGRPFIQIDNVRGKLDSQMLEMAITAAPGAEMACRVPHKQAVHVDPRRYSFFISSNGVETTVDLVNRASIVRITKKPEGYVFRKFAEGGIREHLNANQSYFLGAVFSIIREWHRLGRKSTGETRHDFRQWSGVMDWIVQKIMNEAPLMEGHRAAQEQKCNPSLVWLRAVALAIKEDGRMSDRFGAASIADICDEHDIELPGLKDTSNEGRIKYVGILLARSIKKGVDTVEIDGISINRIEDQRYDENHKGYRTCKSYTFNYTTTATTATTAITPTIIGETPIFSSISNPCGSGGSAVKQQEMPVFYGIDDDDEELPF